MAAASNVAQLGPEQRLEKAQANVLALPTLCFGITSKEIVIVEQVWL